MKRKTFNGMQRARRLRGDLKAKPQASQAPQPMGRLTPPYVLGSCPDCEHGPAPMALIPGEACSLCGGYPAGAHDTPWRVP